MNKILIIDGNSILYRSYYAFNGIKDKFIVKINSNSEDIFTHATFGFIKLFLKMIKQDYEKIIVVFDKNKKTFRNEYYENYKVNRKSMPTDLFYQFKMVKEFLKAINVEYLEKDNFEADDLAGSLIKYFQNKNLFFLTSDKDYLQLINKNVNILLIKKTAKDIQEWNFSNFSNLIELRFPKQIIDFKILSGDKSDDIPKIKDISEKTAIILLNIYDSIYDIYLDISNFSIKLNEYKIKNNLRINISKIQDSLNLNKTEILNRFNWLPIKKDIEINFNSNKIMNLSSNEFYEFCKKYSMNSFIKNNDKLDIQANNEIEIENFFILKEWKNNYNDEKNFILIQYFERNNYHNIDPLGVAIVNSKGKFYLNFKIIINDKLLQIFLESDKYKKYSYDIKPLIYIFKKYNINVQGFEYDLLLALYILNPNIINVFQYCSDVFLQDNIIIKSDDDIFGKGIKKVLIKEDIYIKYLFQKINILQNSYSKVISELKKNSQYLLYNDIELPLSFVLADMEFEGIKINSLELKNQCNNIKKKIDLIYEKFNNELKENYKLTKKYNLNSAKQISELLYIDLKINLKNKKIKKNNLIKKTKLSSSNINNLQKIKDHSILIEYIIKYRKLYKIYSTYLKGFEKFLDKNNIIHTTYKQNHVITGRLSSSNPNMQNIIGNDEVKKIFITKNNGNIFFSFDYSQIELRILAQLANDNEIIELFKNNEDIHLNTALRLFNTNEKYKIDDLRKKAKAVNFGIIYGITKYGLSKMINESYDESEKIINKYFETHPNIKKYIQNQINICKKNKYVKNIFNRRRDIPNIISSNKKYSDEAIREAINMPIQSTAADILKVAMINIFDKFKKNKLKSKIILQIHDELIFEVLKSEEQTVKNIVNNEMINVKYIKDWDVKLEVNFNKNNNLSKL